MFLVTAADAAAIRAAYDEGGERAAVVKHMRLFPAITHPARALRCVRILVNWKPLTMPRPSRSQGTASAPP